MNTAEHSGGDFRYFRVEQDSATVREALGRGVLGLTVLHETDLEGNPIESDETYPDINIDIISRRTPPTGIIRVFGLTAEGYGANFTVPVNSEEQIILSVAGDTTPVASHLPH